MNIRFWLRGLATLLLTGILYAQTPAGATGQCKDGTYSTAAHKAGACSGHKGVQTWFTADTNTSVANSSVPAATTAPSANTAQRLAPASAPAATPSAVHAQADGGGPGMVWVNTSSKVYHCYGGRDYGTTKAGKYESEASARAEGARPAYGKTCSQ